MTSLQPGYRAYLLRLWHTAETTGGWRASLEDPHTGERRAFGSLAELAAFLAEQPVGGRPHDPPARASEPPAA